MTADNIRVLLADDSAELLGAMRAVLRTEPGLTLVGTVRGADDLMREVETRRPDVMVVDLTMPGASPLKAVRDVTSAHPEVRAVVYSGYDDATVRIEAFNAGASAFVSKHDELAELFETVRRVARDRNVAPPSPEVAG